MSLQYSIIPHIAQQQIFTNGFTLHHRNTGTPFAIYLKPMQHTNKKVRVRSPSPSPSSLVPCDPGAVLIQDCQLPGDLYSAATFILEHRHYYALETRPLKSLFRCFQYQMTCPNFKGMEYNVWDVCGWVPDTISFQRSQLGHGNLLFRRELVEKINMTQCTFQGTKK